MSLLLHFTDTHLYAEPELHQLKGMNTTESLTKVLDAAWYQQGQPQGVLLGGDLAQDDSLTAYQNLKQMLDARWQEIPLQATVGNHDDARALEQVFGDPAIQEFPGWRVICVSTQHEGRVAGRISASDLVALDQALNCDSHALIVMHHPPVRIGSRWLDEINLTNADAFWRVVDAHDNVRGVLFGHAHQAFHARRHGIKVMGTPSTCLQFKPGSDECEFERIEPGYRWLELYEDGRIESGVERVKVVLPEDLTDTSAY